MPFGAVLSPTLLGSRTAPLQQTCGQFRPPPQVWQISFAARQEGPIHKTLVSHFHTPRRHSAFAEASHPAYCPRNHEIAPPPPDRLRGLAGPRRNPPSTLRRLRRVNHHPIGLRSFPPPQTG